MLKIVFSLLVISATTLADPVLKPQIIGGTDAKRGDNPHMCSLRSTRHGCGASIISAKWAITAAHCVEGYVKYFIIVGLPCITFNVLFIK
jgi:secreted trypsin-like serine protease